MNNELEQKRLTFAVGRAKTSLEIKPENLVVKARRNSSHKCKDGRDEFSYLRSDVILAIDKAMEEENTQIDSVLLKRSIQRVIAENKTNDNTLSA